MELLKEVNDEDQISIHAYDGEMNAMNFNHIRGSKAFDANQIIEVVDDDYSWLNN